VYINKPQNLLYIQIIIGIMGNNKMTYTWIPSYTHDAVKIYAVLNRMKIPDAYEHIIIEGLKGLNFDVSRIKK